MALSNTVADEGLMEGLSLEEFKRFAETHDGAWELDNGVPVKMQSPSIAHQWISLEIAAAFREYLRERKCRVLQDMDVWTGRFLPDECASRQIRSSVRRPDILVYCDKSQKYNNTVLRPQLVAEIWSPTNSPKERNKKMEEYFRIGVDEFWQIDLADQTFTLFSFQNNNLRFLSWGTFHEPLKSDYFPGLEVDLSEYYTEFGETLASDQSN